MISVRLPEPLRNGRPEIITMSATTLGEVIDNLGIESERDELYNFAVNGDLILHGEKNVQLRAGDEIEIVVAFSGG